MVSSLTSGEPMTVVRLKLRPRQKRHGPCPGTVPWTPVHAGWTRQHPSQPGPLHVGASQAGSEPLVPPV
jgi:hypothetical protein